MNRTIATRLARLEGADTPVHLLPALVMNEGWEKFEAVYAPMLERHGSRAAVKEAYRKDGNEQAVALLDWVDSLK